MPSHVTKREAQAVCDYAADVCTAMHMQRWKILVMDEPADEDARAQITTVDGVNTAQLWLASDWMKIPYADRREVITHEVMHLLHERVSTVVIDDSKPYMRDHEHDDWTRRVKREFELMVDHLAVFLAATHSLEQAWDAAHGC